MTLAEKRMFDTMMDIRILTLELEELEAEREDPNCEDVAYLSMCPIADTKYKIEALYRQSHEPGISGGELRLLLKFHSGVPESSLDKKVVRHQCEIADHCTVFIHEQMKIAPAFLPIHLIKCRNKEEYHCH